MVGSTETGRRSLRWADPPAALVASAATPASGEWIWEAEFTEGASVASLPGPLARITYDLCETLPRLVSERGGEFVRAELRRFVREPKGTLQ